jgi:ribonuclease P protein component
MLKKAHRLNRTAFSSYFSSGKRSHGTYLTIIYQPSTTLLSAAVVGKKVSKKAVLRNRVRRRLYSVVERSLLTAGKTGVFILVAKPSIASLSRLEFVEKVSEELGRVIK